MLYKIVRKERLNRYRNKVCQLNFLKRKKFELLDSFGLKAYDYSKIKVTSGNGRKLTDQEKAVMSIENFDRKIRQLEAEIQPEMDELEKQIERVDGKSDNWRHAEALRSFYLFGESKLETAEKIYGESTKQDVKNLNELLKVALEYLEKVSSTPFVEVQQITMEDWFKEGEQCTEK